MPERSKSGRGPAAGDGAGAIGSVCHNSSVSLDPFADPRARVLALLKRNGREATSFQMLEPGLSYWFDGDDACVAYAEVGGAFVTVGEPVAPPEDIATVVERFTEYARTAGRRARFFHVGEEFTRTPGLAGIHIGEQPVWDPTRWDETLESTRSLRDQLKRARNKGVLVRIVSVQEMAREDGRLRAACEMLIKRWLASRRMDEMKFMVLVHPFDFAEERSYAVAEHEGAIVGFAAAVPVYGRNGWFIEDLLRDTSAPNGTAEALVDALMRKFAAEGARYVTLGIAPLSGDVNRLLSFTRDTTARLYNFAGVRAFKEKLRPGVWEPVYVAFPKGELGVLAMRDVLLAFAPGGFVRFGLNSLLHQRTLATALLAAGLVPWTVALAWIDTARWFPSLTIQRAWTLFDVMLIALMVSLVVRWRARVAELVVALTTLDAALTMTQVLLWNIWTTQGLLAWTAVALGCLGPLLAALFFWTTRRLSMRAKVLVLPRS